MRLISADLLRVLIRERGLSYRDLATRTGCSPGFISHLTSGRRPGATPALATAIAEVLAVPTSVLFVPAMSINAVQNVPGSAA